MGLTAGTRTRPRGSDFAMVLAGVLRECAAARHPMGYTPPQAIADRTRTETGPRFPAGWDQQTTRFAHHHESPLFPTPAPVRTGLLRRIAEWLEAPGSAREVPRVRDGVQAVRLDGGRPGRRARRAEEAHTAAFRAGGSHTVVIPADIGATADGEAGVSLPVIDAGLLGLWNDGVPLPMILDLAANTI